MQVRYQAALRPELPAAREKLESYLSGLAGAKSTPASRKNKHPFAEFFGHSELAPGQFKAYRFGVGAVCFANINSIRAETGFQRGRADQGVFCTSTEILV
jgi:hypothetical protein